MGVNSGCHYISTTICNGITMYVSCVYSYTLYCSNMMYKCDILLCYVQCGRAVIQAACPECGATIGGTGHAMTTGNQPVQMYVCIGN